MRDIFMTVAVFVICGINSTIFGEGNRSYLVTPLPQSQSYMAPPNVVVLQQPPQMMQQPQMVQGYGYAPQQSNYNPMRDYVDSQNAMWDQQSQINNQLRSDIQQVRDQSNSNLKQAQLYTDEKTNRKRGNNWFSQGKVNTAAVGYMGYSVYKNKDDNKDKMKKDLKIGAGVILLNTLFNK